MKIPDFIKHDRISKDTALNFALNMSEDEDLAEVFFKTCVSKETTDLAQDWNNYEYFNVSDQGWIILSLLKQELITTDIEKNGIRFRFYFPDTSYIEMWSGEWINVETS